MSRSTSLMKNFLVERVFRKRGFGVRRVEYYCKDGLLVLKIYLNRYWSYLSSPAKKIISALLLCSPFKSRPHVYDVVVLGFPNFDIRLIGSVKRVAVGNVLVAIGSSESFRVVLPVIKECCPDIVEVATPVKLDFEGVQLIGILRRYRVNPPFGSAWINIYEYSF